MKAAVITFPGSNCDRDLRVAFEAAGFETHAVWHKDTSLPSGTDVVGVPGGFSFGDYLRCGAIAAQSPVAQALRAHAERGGFVLAICNGFQVVTEMGLLPGVLMRNAGLKFICKPVQMRVEGKTPFTEAYASGTTVTYPIAHHDGNYTADPETLARLEGEGRVAFRYLDNPNGSMNDIAGIVSENRRVLGLMPHPERAIDATHGNRDGAALFGGLLQALAPA
jgi:phosphoribosylformylglycinamidine synthase subunit PurQ / glutaminase